MSGTRQLAQYGAGIPGQATEGAPRADYINEMAPPNAFGAINAATSQKVGAESQNASGQLEQAANTIQDRQNKTATDDAFNQYQTQLTNAMFGDPDVQGDRGLVGMQGKDALDAGPGVIKHISQLREQIKAGLQNGAQRLAFDEASRRILTATSEQVGRHLEAQQQAWSLEVGKSALDTQARSAGLNYNDDDALMHQLADSNRGGINTFRTRFGGDGTNPEALQAGIDNQGVVVQSAIQGAVAHGDYTRANQIFEKFGSVLAPHIAASLGQELSRRAKSAGNDAYLDHLLGGDQPGNSGLNGAPRPNTQHHTAGDLVVADKPSGQTIEQPAVDRATQVRDGLIKRGLDPITATAFAANALHESAAKPDSQPGDQGNAHGLMMWTDKEAGGQPGRASKFRSLYGSSPENMPLDKQLDFIMQELHGDEAGAFAAINSAQGLAAKTAAVSKYYERPRDINGEQARRGATALQLAQQIGQSTGQAAPAGGAATTPAQTEGKPPSTPPSPGVTTVSSTGEQPQAQPIPTQVTPDKAPADQYPDESALTLQVLRDTRGDPEQRAALLSGLRQRMSIIHMATETDRQNLVKSLPNIEAALSDGKEDVTIPEAQIRHLLPPADAAAKIEDLQTAQQAGVAFRSVAWGTPADIIAARQQLTAGMGPGSTTPKKGSAGGVGEEQPETDQGTEAYRLRQRILAKFDEKVAARNVELQKDPVAFVGNAPTVAAAAQKLDNNDPQSIQNYFNAVSAAQTHLGIPESQQHLLSQQQASAKATQLNSMDPTQTDVGKTLIDMGKTYGDAWGRVFGDMVHLGKLNPQYQTLAMIGNAATRNDFQRMLATAQEKGGTSTLKEAAGKQAEADINQNIEATLTDFKKSMMVPGITSNVDMINQIRSGINDLALFYTLQGQDGATAVKNAANGILGRYDFEGSMRIPKGTGGQVQMATDNAVANLKAEDLAAPAGAYDIRNGPRVNAEHPTQDEAAVMKRGQEDMLAMVQKKATWVTNESDNGVVLFTQARDGRMISVRHADGSRVEVSFANLGKQSAQSGGAMSASDYSSMGF